MIGALRSLLFGTRPESRLDQARIGEAVRLRGNIVPRDLIESPLSGEKCVYYSFRVDAWRQSVQGLGGDGFWRNVEQDEAIAEFYLQVGSQRIIVAPAAAEVRRALGPNLVEVEYGVVGRRASEMLLRAGDLVEVDGVLAAADDLFDDSRSYRQRAERFMVTSGQGKLKIQLL